MTSFSVKSFKPVQNVQSRLVKCGLREIIWCSMFKVDRCSMYPGSLPLIFNGSVPRHGKLINVRRCSMYTGVQLDRFHCRYDILQLKVGIPCAEIISVNCISPYLYRTIFTIFVLTFGIRFAKPFLQKVS